MPIFVQKNIKILHFMRRLSFVFASLMMLVSLKTSAQNERVLLFECFTNTSCGPCAQQNPGLDQLIDANAGRIAAIKYHMSWPGANDPMYLHNTADNNARKGVYNINAVPHTVVDGIRFSNMPANLNQNTVNQLLAIESPFEMRLSYEVNEADNTISVHVMGRASQSITGNVKLYVGVIEQAIHYNTPPGSNGEKDFYSVMKKLLPSSSGTHIGDVQAGDYFAYNFTWELANIYDMGQLDAIAWVQNANTKEVYQACKSSQDMTPFFGQEAALSDIGNVKSVICSGLASPSVLLTNFGSQSLTTAQLEVSVNGETLKTVTWNGNLPTFASETVELGDISFAVEDNNTLEVQIMSVNGGSDEAPMNDMATFAVKGAPENVGKTLKLSIRTDNNPQETTWQVKNMETGEVVLQGGPYENANTMYNETLEITGDGCYDFTIFDAGGDGLTDGQGLYGLKAGNTTLFSGGQFGSSESNEFSYEVYEGVGESQSTVGLFPNPTTGKVSIVSEAGLNVTVYNMAGQRVHESTSQGLLQIDLKRHGAGIYAVKVGDECIRVVVE